jgi:hypothetical protein
MMTGLLHIPEVFAASANLGVLALAEGPVALIRGTARYEAAAGTPLQPGDFIDSDESAVQIEGLAGARIATGPHTRLYLDRKGTATQVILLSGWLKIDALPGIKGGKLVVDATGLSVDMSHAVSVVHTDGTDTEVFCEAGTLPLSVASAGGVDGHTLSLRQEEYAQRKGNGSVDSTGRPDAGFLQSMPSAFFDPLPAVALKKQPAPVPGKLREVSVEDVAPLLSQLPKADLRALAKRFAPRLADASFRAAVTQQFGGTLEWETELYRFERNAVRR